MVDPNVLIAEYRTAFETANGSLPAPRISYERGWYAITTSGFGTRRVRKVELIMMRDTLLSRIESVKENLASPNPKGLMVRIFRNMYRDHVVGYGFIYRYVDCSNNGVSADSHDALVIGPGIPGIFEAGKMPILVLTANHNNTVKLVPKNGGKGVGPMFGGNFAHTSDDRFSAAIKAITGHYFYGAIAIHDRYEEDLI